MLKKWTIFIFIACISPVIFMLVYSLFLPTDREEFSQEEFAGVVSDKFRDQKNHNVRTVLIGQAGKDTYVLRLTWDTTFYDKARINDSVLKVKNYDGIITKRKDTSYISKIQFRPE